MEENRLDPIKTLDLWDIISMLEYAQRQIAYYTKVSGRRQFLYWQKVRSVCDKEIRRRTDIIIG